MCLFHISIFNFKCIGLITISLGKLSIYIICLKTFIFIYIYTQ